MSAFEALKALAGKASWLSEREPEVIEPVIPPTPLEEEETLLLLARGPKLIDPQSVTWKAVSRWAALELIAARSGLETATGDRAAYLRERCRTLRDLLAMNEQDDKTVISDQGPVIP